MRATARAVACDALKRIDADGAYANLVVGSMIDRAGLSDMDRRFVTELVYGTTRMRRACDALVDRFVSSPPDPATQTLLRLGAYQLGFAGVAPHAAVSETVALAPRRVRGFVNAVLRKVSAMPMVWPSPLVELSYPDWIGSTLTAELGEADAFESMRRMNQPPPVSVRADGYVQDESSQWVAAAVDAAPGKRVLDICAAPGGKATALAGRGAEVIAADKRAGRVGLIEANAERLNAGLHALVADATAPPFAPSSFDAVLVDAPCSGLGALRRRPDARWRVTPADIEELAALQARILAAAASLVVPGGQLVYSVCTLTAAESTDHATPDGFTVDATPPATGRWRPAAQGWRVLPQDADTDGMTMVRYRRER